MTTVCRLFRIKWAGERERHFGGDRNASDAGRGAQGVVHYGTVSSTAGGAAAQRVTSDAVSPVEDRPFAPTVLIPTPNRSRRCRTPSTKKSRLRIRCGTGDGRGGNHPAVLVAAPCIRYPRPYRSRHQAAACSIAGTPSPDGRRPSESLAAQAGAARLGERHVLAVEPRGGDPPVRHVARPRLECHEPRRGGRRGICFPHDHGSVSELSGPLRRAQWTQCWRRHRPHAAAGHNADARERLLPHARRLVSPGGGYRNRDGRPSENGQ